MKIKITLIAFLASALIFTSCMKNESSPGIESVREAYAALLQAKAQAEITIANANAAFTLADAAVQTSLAAINDAKAALDVQEVARLQAVLAQQMIEWGFANDQAALDAQIALAVFQAAVDSTNNALAMDYFGKYAAALTQTRAIQDSIFNVNASILSLGLDLENGTTNHLDSLNAALIVNNSTLVSLQAEYETAQGLVGDADAVAARLLELRNDSTTYQSQKLALMAQLAECTATAGTAPVAPSMAAYTAAYDASVDTAQAKLDFFALHPAPTFWTDAQGDIDDAQDSLNTLRADSATAYGLWKTQQDIIDNQYDDLVADKADANQEISDLNDSIDLYGVDTLATLTAWDNAVTQWTQDTSDNAQRQRDLDILTDSLTAQRARYIIAPTAGLLATITINAGDSTQFEIDIAYHDTNTIPAAEADTLTAYNAWLAADGTYDTKVNTVPGGFLDLIADQNNIIDDIDNNLWPARTQDIADAEATVDDLWSDYLYTQTWIDEQVVVLAQAIATKDALQTQYETYMDAFFWDDYMAGLELAAANAWTAYQGALGTYTTAKDAWDLLNAPCLALQDDIDALTAQLEFIRDVINTYVNAAAFNTNFLDAFEQAISQEQNAIIQTQANIVNAQQAYADGVVNYDYFMDQITSLQAELVSAQAMVTYWKALLDGVLAN